VLAGVDQQAGRQQQRPGASRRDQNALGVDGQPMALLVEAGDRLAQPALREAV
jgi:hypothetical protein